MPVKYHLAGLTAAVLLGQDPTSLASTRQAQVAVSFSGFEGDLHSGLTRRADSRTPWYVRGTEIRNDRQVTVVSQEELAQIAADLDTPEILPEWLGANLLVSGIPRLSYLPPNTRLVFPQGAVLIVQNENLPCSGPGKVIAAHLGRAELQALFPRAALHRRGLVACVEKPGVIASGEPLAVEVPEQVIYLVD